MSSHKGKVMPPGRPGKQPERRTRRDESSPSYGGVIITLQGMIALMGLAVVANVMDGRKVPLALGVAIGVLSCSSLIAAGRWRRWTHFALDHQGAAHDRSPEAPSLLGATTSRPAKARLEGQLKAAGATTASSEPGIATHDELAGRVAELQSERSGHAKRIQDLEDSRRWLQRQVEELYESASAAQERTRIYAEGLSLVESITLDRPPVTSDPDATLAEIRSTADEVLAVVTGARTRAGDLPCLARAAHAARLLAEEMPRWHELCALATNARPDIWLETFLAIGDTDNLCRMVHSAELAHVLLPPQADGGPPTERTARQPLRRYLVDRVWSTASAILCANEFVQRVGVMVDDAPCAASLAVSSARMSTMVRALLETGGIEAADLALFRTTFNGEEHYCSRSPARLSACRPYAELVQTLFAAGLLPEGAIIEVHQWGYTGKAGVMKAHVVPYILGAGL